MKIKEPDSENALESLWIQLDLAQDKLANCVNQNHDSTAVLYISSLIISPTVIFNGTKLLNKISNVINISPQRCICVVRTTTPQYYARVPSMRTLQQRSIDFLRDKCYVILYSKQREFLNHAKFFLHYHMCLSERIVHYGNFYGSTNLTQVGLGNPHNRGNYEEYAANHRIKYKLSGRDKSYLSEVLDLIRHKASLFTDSQYLSQHVSDHQRLLEHLLQQARENPVSSSRRRLYENYIDLQRTYVETLAFLDEIPGKNLTQGIIEKLTSSRLPTSPFELEMMVVDPEYSELALENLDLSEDSIRISIEEGVEVIRNASLSIKEEYRPAIQKIRDYFDQKETVFLEFLIKNSEVHFEKLGKIMSTERI